MKLSFTTSRTTFGWLSTITSLTWQISFKAVWIRWMTWVKILEILSKKCLTFPCSLFRCWSSLLARTWAGASMSVESRYKESINMARLFRNSLRRLKRKVSNQSFGGATQATSLGESRASSVASALSTRWLARPFQWSSARRIRSSKSSKSMQADSIATLINTFGGRPARKVKVLDDWAWTRRWPKTEFCIRRTKSLDFHPPFGCCTFRIKIENFPLHAWMLFSYFHFSTSAAPAIKKQSNYNFSPSRRQFRCELMRMEKQLESKQTKLKTMSKRSRILRSEHRERSQVSACVKI